MTLLLEVLREQRAQAVDGPARYEQAWDRMVELVSPIWHNEPMWGGSCLPDGGAALAVALYLIAEEHQVHPRDVRRDQIEALLVKSTETGMTLPATLPLWEGRLRALRHDLDAGTDPVSVIWRRLRRDNSPPETACDDTYFDSTHRWDYGFVEGLDVVLAPRYALAF
ncbi:hypothetical protein AB0D14_36120 [Streptomyces sp. NPDC048484]|uniref:hypothetical protein n=1 Tax=Streptomyces sp. NPDC048484 TaxID=3155146 RepID=UPI0034187ED8